jgi:putative N-acetylmannosamine-6-phosphate epimerase
MTYKTKMLISLGLVAAGFALIKIEDFKNRKRAAKNEEILKRNAAANEVFMKDIANINDDLDRRIEAGKFWLIVTDPEN